MIAQPVLQARAVELAQGDQREFHLEPGPGAQEAVDEDLAGMADVHLVEPLVEGRDQHGGPEQVDRPSTLADAGSSQSANDLARPVVAAERQAGQAVADPQLVSPVQVAGGQETLRSGGTERGRVRPGAARPVPSGLRKHDVRLAAEQVGDPDPPAEIGQVRAAGHADMLAVVDLLAGDRVGERAGPAAQPGPAFQERDPQAATDQCRRRGQAGQAATDDHHMRRGGLVYQRHQIGR